MYNKLYVHSEPGYISPEEFEKFYLRQISLREGAWGDTEIWVGLRKSIVGQMVRSFFTG
jgi:hypothetical protein